MIFTEATFLLFFGTIFSIYWIIQSNKLRKWLLLTASYFFYSCWDWRFLSLIILTTLVDFFAAHKIETAHSKKPKKLWLATSIIVNLGVLSIFKYLNFFISSFIDLQNTMDLNINPHTVDIALPLGISFYTFHALSHSIEVYQKKMPAEKSFLNFALFVAFFPKLIAGPIVRAKDFLLQLDKKININQVDVRWYMLLFLIGFVKKTCISDNVAPYVDKFFEAPQLYNTASSWLASMLYTLQIYCDFSGYSDMAIATAGLLGYKLCENFSAPYLAINITEFWRKWHISLSSWFRNYLYIPLGGNRAGRPKMYRNLMITMFLCGLWHGAGLNFILWGILHGGALIIHREWSSHRAFAKANYYPLNWFLTLIFVNFAWVLFRAPSFEIALRTWTTMLSYSPGQATLIEQGAPVLWLSLVVALTTHKILNSTYLERTQPFRKLPTSLFAFCYGACWLLAITSKSITVMPFIYFQF